MFSLIFSLVLSFFLFFFLLFRNRFSFTASTYELFSCESLIFFSIRVPFLISFSFPHPSSFNKNWKLYNHTWYDDCLKLAKIEDRETTNRNNDGWNWNSGTRNKYDHFIQLYIIIWDLSTISLYLGRCIHFVSSFYCVYVFCHCCLCRVHYISCRCYALSFFFYAILCHKIW